MSHRMPSDFKAALEADVTTRTAWNNVTPKARNEWICWIISVKQDKTRLNHIQRACNELARGKRRPCCWTGCVHRTDKSVSPWVQKVVLDTKH